MAKRARRESSVPDDVPDSTANSRSVVPSSLTEHTPKYASVEPEAIDSGPSSIAGIRCLLLPHKPLTFSTASEHESHYQLIHTNRCAECDNNFPTSHFLELHIAENHNPIAAGKREAGEKTFACFVEGCEKVCRDWKKRRSHLVDKHYYPKNYDFLVVDHGIDGRRSMLRPGIDAQGHRKSSRERGRSDSSVSEATQTTEATSVSEQHPTPVTQSTEYSQDIQPTQSDMPQKIASSSQASALDDLTSSMSALNMVPRSITFGKRKGRAGFAKG